LAKTHSRVRGRAAGFPAFAAADADLRVVFALVIMRADLQWF
jgi:hypothetical protein